MKKYWGLLLVLLLSWWTIAPLLHSGFFPIHDNTQVVRVQQMAQALRDGQFPVRWVADLGYGFGYPIFNFYAPLAYYVGALFNLIGFNILVATKLMMVLGILLSGLFMYLLAREFWGEIGGILSGLFYIYAPYHAIDIYVRGAAAEFWAMAFLPLVPLSIYKLYQNTSEVELKLSQSPRRWKELRWIWLGALSLAAVILSHNLTAMMFALFLLLAILVLLAFSKSKKQFIHPFRRNPALRATSYIILLTLGLSAFYWLPALSEMGLTKVLGQIGGGADFRDHFVFLDQLWASPWGFAGSAPGRLDGMSFMIGKLHLLFALLALIASFFFWKKNKRQSVVILFSVFCFLFSVLLTNQVSQPIWEAIPLMAFVQYPWRFLVFATFSASFIAGSVILWFKKIQDYPGLGTIPGLSWVMGGIIILVLLFFNTKYFQPQTYLDVSAADYINEENIKWKTSKISDEYLPKDFPTPGNKNEVAWDKVAVLEGEAEIKNLVLKSHQYTFDVGAKTDTEILINTAHFPGWKVWVDGEETDFILDNGKIKFSLSAGDHQILARLTNTSIRTTSNLISLISWLGLAGLVVFQKKLPVFPRCQ